MKRQMTVYYSTDQEPGYGGWYSAGNLKPMVRISNRFLLRSGFKVGDKVEVEYKDEEIIIRKAKGDIQNKP